jgi:hypothetical protein
VTAGAATRSVRAASRARTVIFLLSGDWVQMGDATNRGYG